MLSVDSIFDEFIQQDVEGITLLGGEPFSQTLPLTQLTAKIRQAGKSVMTFTGYTLKQLKSIPNSKLLLRNTDLLIDGPYINNLPEQKRPCLGSANQKVYFLSNRYNNLFNDGSVRNMLVLNSHIKFVPVNK